LFQLTWNTFIYVVFSFGCLTVNPKSELLTPRVSFIFLFFSI
jgi:hypothetical protein